MATPPDVEVHLAPYHAFTTLDSVALSRGRLRVRIRRRPTGPLVWGQLLRPATTPPPARSAVDLDKRTHHTPGKTCRSSTTFARPRLGLRGWLCCTSDLTDSVPGARRERVHEARSAAFGGRARADATVRHKLRADASGVSPPPDHQRRGGPEATIAGRARLRPQTRPRSWLLLRRFKSCRLFG
jgi:hypothetical protein